MKIKSSQKPKEHIKGVESNKIFTCGVGKDFEKRLLSLRNWRGNLKNK
ncbi:hypothetical protein [Helicobacter aurati]|nr:hypothetical protein [Helicobacter aurati]